MITIMMAASMWMMPKMVNMMTVVMMIDNLEMTTWLS